LNINRRILVPLAGVMSLVLIAAVFFLFGGKNKADGTPSKEWCGQSVHYYRHDLPESVNRFGPAAGSEQTDALLKELHFRRCTDPALTVAHREYQQGVYSSPSERLQKTLDLANNPSAWRLNVTALELREQKAKEVSVVEMSESYKTLYMTDTTTPTIYAAELDRPTYRVLRFTYADGTVENYKLDCGFQPVSPEFPGVPGKPKPPTTPTTRPPTTTTRVCGTLCKGPDVQPAPCVDNAGVRCDGIPGSGGSPGNGGAVDHGDDGYSPSDPPPPTVVTTAPPPTSVVTLPPTTSPPTTIITAPPG